MPDLCDAINQAYTKVLFHIKMRPEFVIDAAAFLYYISY